MLKYVRFIILLVVPCLFSVYALTFRHNILAAEIQQASPEKVADNETQPSAIVETLNTCSVNPRCLQLDGRPILFWMTSAPSTPGQSLHLMGIALNNQSDNGQTNQPLPNNSFSAAIGPNFPSEVNIGYGDFCVCNDSQSSGYIVTPLLAMMAGTKESYYGESFFSWSLKGAQLEITPLPDVRRKLGGGIMNPDIAIFQKKIIIAAESASNGLIRSALSDDNGKTWQFSALPDSRGANPRLSIVGDTIYLTYTHFTNPYYRLFDNATIAVTQSKDGMTWSKPINIMNISGAMQAKLTSDSSERLFLLFSKFEQYAHGLPVSDYSFALQSGVITSLWITSSSDQGKTWTEPLQITDGEHADHYPEVAICDKRLKVFWSRQSQLQSETPAQGKNLGVILQKDLGEADSFAQKLRLLTK